MLRFFYNFFIANCLQHNIPNSWLARTDKLLMKSQSMERETWKPSCLYLNAQHCERALPEMNRKKIAFLCERNEERRTIPHTSHRRKQLCSPVSLRERGFRCAAANCVVFHSRESRSIKYKSTKPCQRCTREPCEVTEQFPLDTQQLLPSPADLQLPLMVETHINISV
jgi:hypothetical protein